MTDNDTEPDETGAEPISPTGPKSRRALSRLKRELTDEELSSPRVQKLLLEYLERAEEEVGDLRSYRDKYYDLDKQIGVFEEKLRISVSSEVVSMGSLAVGAAAVGFAPSLWSTQPSGWVVLAFGAVLTIVGVIAKVIRP